MNSPVNSTAATPASALWAHALNVYAQHAASLLQAQDQFGADVCLLLYAHWRAQSGICLTAEDWQQILDATATQRAQISALRERRRQLKPRTSTPAGGGTCTGPATETSAKNRSDETDASPCYAEAKARELAAEKTLLDTLNAWAGSHGSQSTGVTHANVTAASVSACWQASVQTYASLIDMERAVALVAWLAPLLPESPA